MNQTLNETINQTLLQGAQTPLGTIPILGNPVYDIFIITLIIAVFTTLVNKHFTDQAKIKGLKKEMKSLQKEMREHIKNNNPKKAQVLQKEMMKKNMESIKQTMNLKIMILTMGPLLIVFSFIRTLYNPYGQFFDLGFTTFGWLGTYILFSLVNSLVLKKVLDVA